MSGHEIERTSLAEKVSRSLLVGEKPYRIKDDSSQLHFTVAPNGSQRWEVRFKRPDGKCSWMGVGGYPAVSAKLARKHADFIQALVSDVKDPREVWYPRPTRLQAPQGRLARPGTSSAPNQAITTY